VSQNIFIQEQTLDEIISGLEIEIVRENWRHSERADADAGVQKVVSQFDISVALQQFD